MAITVYAGNSLVGLSTDSKPTNIPDGARFYETDTGEIYIKVSGSWEFTNTANSILTKLKTVDGAGSGLDADLLDGWSSSSMSTVDTVVVRNNSGDINARLFRSEYDSTNATIGYIMTQVDTMSNNYMRPSTPAQVRAGLNVENGAEVNNISDANATDLTDGGVTTLHSHSGSSSIPSGTSMIFNQSSAPSGWTKKTNWASNSSIIVGNTYGSGGSDSPTSWTTALVSAGHSLTEAQLASHDHGDGTLAASNAGGHGHAVRTQSAGGSSSPNNYPGYSASQNSYNWESALGAVAVSDHSHTVSGSTANAGSGSSHSHTLTQDTYTPTYQIMIAATKD